MDRLHDNNHLLDREFHRLNKNLLDKNNKGWGRDKGKR